MSSLLGVRFRWLLGEKVRSHNLKFFLPWQDSLLKRYGFKARVFLTVKDTTAPQTGRDCRGISPTKRACAVALRPRLFNLGDV